MNQTKSYDRHLRNIGQSLEAQRINTFELRYEDERYWAKGDPDKEISLLTALRQWQQRWRSKGLSSSLSYTLLDIEQLERQGKTKRSRPNRLPDFYSLPNILRTLGAYLDARDAELIELHKRPLTITLLYRNRDGHPDVEERSIASFYDFFLKLHGRRHQADTR
ncbi:MAG: hypothetical protein ACM3TN_07480 [Alphaproteobacteria bacterium]